MADMSQASVEAYLQRNPDFAKDWFLHNVGKDELSEWVSEPDSVPSLKKCNMEMKSLKEVPRNSLTSQKFHDFVSGKRKVVSGSKRKKADLLKMNEMDLFMELIRDIANELDVNIICHKILLNVSILTKSDRGSLFLVRGTKENKYLVSKLFDVTEDSSLEDSLHSEEQQIRVPFGRGIAGTVAETKRPINIKDAYEVSNFISDS